MHKERKKTFSIAKLLFAFFFLGYITSSYAFFPVPFLSDLFYPPMPLSKINLWPPRMPLIYLPNAPMPPLVVLDDQIAPKPPLARIAAAPEVAIDHLPMPEETPRLPKLLSLQDAILLALRNNPDVISSQLTRILDKYSLELAQFQYQPQYTLNGSYTTARGTAPASSLNAGATLNTSFGTQIAGNAGVTRPGANSQSLTITQPLIRDFGEVALVPLENAKDTEEVNKLNFKNAMITMVSTIITDYYTLVQDYNNLRTQYETLKAQQQTVDQYKLQVKVGKMAKSDLLQQAATLATTKLDTNRQQNELEQDYQTLLNDINLNENTKLKIDQRITVEQYPLPTNDQAIEMALSGNISYQSLVLQMKIIERGLITAENSNKWKLDAIGNVNMQDFQAQSGSPSLELQLDVPINDLNRKAELVQAKVAIMQGRLNLSFQKRTLIRSVINALTQLRFQLETIKLSENAVQLKEASLNAEQIKLKYGKSTVFNVTTLENELLNQQIELINTKITYMLNVNQFQVLLGTTLDVWKLQLRYYGADDHCSREILYGS